MRFTISACLGLLVLFLFYSPLFAQNNEIEAKRNEAIEVIDRMIVDAKYNLAMSEVIGYKQRETGKKGFPDPNGEGDPAPTRIKMEEGPLIKTERPLDIAICGEGFLRVIDGRTNEIIYTRYGSLEVTPSGALCLIIGNVVRLLDPQVTIPEGHFHIQINNDGHIWSSTDQFSEKQLIGQLELATFASSTRLKPLDEYFFFETEFSGPPTCGNPGINGYGTLKSEYLEGSNVNAKKMHR